MIIGSFFTSASAVVIPPGLCDDARRFPSTPARFDEPENSCGVAQLGTFTRELFLKFLVLARHDRSRRTVAVTC